MKSSKSVATSVVSDGLSRRKFIVASGGGLMALGLLPLLEACGSSAPNSSAGGNGGPPQRGGTLKVGLTGGQNADTLDPHLASTAPDMSRAFALYDQLVRTSAAGPSELRLAQSIVPNPDATKWTITVKPNVKFHDGQTLSAADILFNFRRIVDNKYLGASALGPVDLKASTVTGPTTLDLVFTSPYSQLIDNLSVWNFGVIPQNWDAKNPVGTGPFKFQSFTPGTESVFVRNDNYWDTSNGPYLDSLIITDVADETAQVNGMQSGQFDAVGSLSAASMAPLQSAGANVVISDTGAFTAFAMRTDIAPFNDVRVRQAFKLLMNRQQFSDQVFGGKAKIGNDLSSIYDPMYDSSIPQRTQDADKAKSLLAEANQTNLNIELYTSIGAGPGAINLAQVFAQQAGDAGVTVKVVQQDSETYFNNTYKKVPFCMEYWQYLPYMAQAGQSFLTDSPWNATFRNDPTYDALYAKASAEVDKAKLESTVHDMLRWDFDNGGWLIPIFLPFIDAWSSRVQGVGKSVAGIQPSGAQWERYWIAQ